MEYVLGAVLILCLVAIFILLFRKSPEKGYPREIVEQLLKQKDDELARLMNEQRETTRQSIEALKSQFATIAADELETRASGLSKKNAEDVKPLFKGVEDKIKELKDLTERIKTDEAKRNGELDRQLENVMQSSRSLGQQADDFVTALKASNKTQGNWGECILENVLEMAGLKKDFDYEVQTGDRNSRPDAIVHCGGGRRIIIDSKVNISDYLVACNTADHHERDERLKAHATQIKNQIKGLASKSYPEEMAKKDPSADYAEVVILMMPSEATYAAALSQDPALVKYACENRIVLASPQMLFGYLVLFKVGMDRIKTIKNHDEIRKQATFIVDRMNSAIEELEKVNKNLNEAQKAYRAAMGKLGDGTNNQSVLGAASEVSRLIGKDMEKAAKKCVK